MLPLSNELIEIRPGRKICVYHSLTNHPITLFFIHGAGGRAEQWREQIKYFQANYNLITVDLLGQGASAKPEPMNTMHLYAFDEFAQDLQLLIQRYHSERNIVLGHSYGGALATYLAWQQPKLINQLILISPLPLGSSVMFAKIFRLPLFILNLIKPWLEKSFAASAFDSGTDPNLVQYETEQASKNPMPIVKAIAAGMDNMPSIDLTQIKQPALLFLSKADQVVPEPLSYAYYKNLANVEIYFAEQAKHLSQLEQPAWVNTLIEKFINTRAENDD